MQHLPPRLAGGGVNPRSSGTPGSATTAVMGCATGPLLAVLGCTAVLLQPWTLCLTLRLCQTRQLQPSPALRKAHAYGPVVATFIYTKGSHAGQGH